MQNEGVLHSDPYYVVDKKFWDKLDNDGKAGLALHEAIFRLSNKKWVSAQVRALNAFVFGDYFEGNRNPESFNLLVDGSGLETPVQAFRAGSSWYYQVTDTTGSADGAVVFYPRLAISPLEAAEPGSSPRESVAQMECLRVGDGAPVTQADLPEFATGLTNVFLWARHQRSATVLIEDPAQRTFTRYFIESLHFEPVAGPAPKTADLWCKRRTKPYWTEAQADGGR